MDEVTAAFANAYQSKRLVYRDIENSDADKELMYTLGPANHVTWGLLNGSLFKDVSKKANNEVLNKLLDSGLLLKVIICLPTIPGEEEAGELSKFSLGVRAAKTRESPTPIGSLTLTAPSGESFRAPVTTLGVCIGEEYQNKGYGAEAISWAVDWAFKFANVHKVDLWTPSYNERASHLYQKIGFNLEGRRREVLYMNRKYYDLIEFGMLESDWKRLRGLE